MKYRKRTNS